MKRNEGGRSNRKPIIERLVEAQPRGEIGSRYLKGLAALAVGATLVTRNSNPLKTLALGVGGGALGNNLNSLVGHRQGAHRSIQTKPGVVNESHRLATGILGGVRMRAVAMHRWHHEHSDTAQDPHAPSVIGRGKVFTDIVGISERFGEEHPEYVAQFESESPYTQPRVYEKTPIFISSLLATHHAAGRKLGLPVPYRAISAGIHISLLYIMNSTYTADVHSDDPANPDEIAKFNYGPVTNVVFGSEDGHGPHHEDPSNARHSDIDAVYGYALLLWGAGLAKIPNLENTEQSQTV